MVLDAAVRDHIFDVIDGAAKGVTDRLTDRPTGGEA